MKNKIVVMVIILCLAGFGNLQANNNKANRFFNSYKYALAIPYYKESLNSPVESVKREAIERLGDCYRLINDVWEAQRWYSRAVTYPNPTPIMYYYLGQSLQCTEQYDEAKAAFLKFSELEPSDARGKILAGYCDSIQILAAWPASAEIKNTTSLNTEYSEFSPVFYKDGLIITSDRKTGLSNESTFDWTNNGYLDLYYSEPKYYRSFWLDFNKPEKMSDSFNQSYHDGPVSFSSDFNTVFLTRTSQEKVKKDLDHIRTNRLQIFYTEKPAGKNVKYNSFPFNNEGYSVGHPAISKNGKQLIFSSDVPGGFGGSDLYYSENHDGKWTNPQNLGPVINTFGNEVFPNWLNDTTLYFSSDGHLGFGGLDLFESHLIESSWGRPVNMLKPINSPFDDFGLAYNAEKKSGFISSDRPSGLGLDDIYSFRNYNRQKPQEVKKPEAPKPEKIQPMACGYVMDKRNFTPIENATVFLLKPGTGEVVVAKTDPSGFFKVPVEPDTRYIAKAMKLNYFDDCLSFTVQASDATNCLPIPRKLLLDKYSLNQTFKVENIYYDLNKWNIRPDAQPPLDDLTRLMEQYPINIELSSHTDSRASDQYNLTLSQKRAESARLYIVSKGINPARIEAKGYGETRLLNRCADGVKCSEQEHQFNRRTEFKITSTESLNFGKKVFDPSPFKEGERLSVQYFDSDFFTSCLYVPKSLPGENLNGRNEEQVKPPVNQASSSSRSVVPSAVPGPANVSGETYFTIQILAGKQSSGASQVDLKGESVFTKDIEGYIKYYVGKFTDYNTAMSEKNRIKSKFPGAFIVAFNNGFVVPVSELIEILK